MTEVEVDVLGILPIRTRLLRTSERTARPEPALEQVAELIRMIERMQFATEGARAGHRWPKLEESTRRAKAREGLDPRILRATGKLYRSVSRKGGARVRVSGGVLEFQVRTDWPIEVHQRGGEHVPRRRIFDFTKVDREKISALIARYIVDGEARARL